MPKSQLNPTTLEMDGIFTEQDIADRYVTMCQCLVCDAWNRREQDEKFICESCGSEKYDMKGARSVRSWLVTKDIKKVRGKPRVNA